MTPLQEVPRNAAETSAHRQALLAQPDEFFRLRCGGRTLDLHEKLSFVENAMARLASVPIYENDIYRVEITSRPPFIVLGITRKDGRPGKCWRDFQAIKNQLVGPENEAVELFPAQSRALDTVTQYHLWVHADPKFRFPLGFTTRFVLNEPLRYRRRPGLEPVDTRREILPADSAASVAVSAGWTLSGQPGA